MTFATSLKEEMSKKSFNLVDGNAEIAAYLIALAKYSKNQLTITSENASVTRKVYKELKSIFGVNPSITVRIQNRFRVKQIYILTVKEKLNIIDKSLGAYRKSILETLVTDEEKTAYLEGSFLAVGSVSDPRSKGYHLEFTFAKEWQAKNVLKILTYFDLTAKIIERGYKYIVYIKASENISDLIKRFQATNSLFYFEDIRIYRDHKNMVNRLNNCEIANQEKTIKTGLTQLEYINYLKENDLFDLLDENQIIVVEMRIKYPEASLQELADIISLETDYKIGKSGVNHQFIKIKAMVERHKSHQEEAS
jgi:hypothetical protein